MVFAKLKLVLFFSVLAMIVVSCGFGQREKNKEALFLVNVLDEKYFKDCTIQSTKNNVYSINIPLDNLPKESMNSFDKEKSSIVVFCANYKCTASAEAAKILKDLGFKHVWAYEGGIAEWQQKGFPVTGPGTQSYLKDFEIPKDFKADDAVPVISAEELKLKIDQF